MPALPFGSAASTPLDDFELVRNGEGQWLLVLPAWPDNLGAASTSSARARLEDDDLLLESASGRVLLRSLISAHYIAALKSDRPGYLLICVVDDDGVRRLFGEVPFSV